MNSLVNGLFLICVLTSTTKPSFSEEDVNARLNPSYGVQNIDSQDSRATEETPGKHSKPLNSIFMGIYKNYKSTYLGNKTLTEYKQSLRETLKNKQQLQQNAENNEALPSEVDGQGNDDGVVTEYLDNTTIEAITFAAGNQDHTNRLPPPPPPSSNRKRKHQQKNSKLPLENITQEVQYNVGPALNLSLDMDNSIVKVNIDGESLKDLVSGRWLSDNTEEGRGKKYEMVTKILPLFILPFLIQSAIVPFLVTKLKLLLIKSMFIGKLAIFLLIISAFRNGNKMMQTYEVAPSYWAGEPSRRSELATAASNMPYNGYRVEGKPAAWIN